VWRQFVRTATWFISDVITHCVISRFTRQCRKSARTCASIASLARIKSTLTRLTKSRWRSGSEGWHLGEARRERRVTMLQGGTFDRVYPRKHPAEPSKVSRCGNVAGIFGTYGNTSDVHRPICVPSHNTLNATGSTWEIIRSEECIRVSARSRERKETEATETMPRETCASSFALFNRIISSFVDVH